MLAAGGASSAATAAAAPPAADAAAGTPATATATAINGTTGTAGTGAITTVSSATVSRAALGVPAPAAPVPQANPDGASLTVSRAGFIDMANPFFTPMGNGRSCASCHSENAGWSVTPRGLAQRFEQSQGADPVFRLVDGANAPTAAVATLDQKRLAYSMLLTKGLIRVGMAMPANAEFTLLRAEDPYNFASARELSLFRRPLPSANLAFLSSVMWDARESQPGASIDSGLLAQAGDAVRGHAEAVQQLSAASQRAIVDFESGLFATQSTSTVAGSLLENGASGGPQALAATQFYPGINDLAGDSRTQAPFNRNVMTMFGAWRNLAAPPPPPRPGQRNPAPAPTAASLARASIARGEALFNNRPFNITQVAGFPQTGTQPQRGSCASCHNAPNAGSHSSPLLLDIGVADGRFRTPDMPLYTLRNNATGAITATTDPGLAMLTGRWRDVGRMKVPVLRNLSARAPYFHNGSQADLQGVVRFYDRRFQIGLTPQEVADLTAFLKAL
ncbi:cytochrome C [Massilia sp. Root418]|nr:cytochrome C [Massilia sp. Root418]